MEKYADMKGYLLKGTDLSFAIVNIFIMLSQTPGCTNGKFSSDSLILHTAGSLSYRSVKPKPAFLYMIQIVFMPQRAYQLSSK